MGGFLIYSCVATPVQIALFDDSKGAMISNYIIDILFLIDIIIIFNSAIFDENLNVINDRAAIAMKYIRSWFFIDLAAIIPFEFFVKSNGEAANLIRFARIGRITKLLKLLKLMRLMKMTQQGSLNVLECVSNCFQFDKNMRWLITFICYFTMTTHVVACIWIIVANFDPNTEHSWTTLSTSHLPSMDRGNLYMTSFYYTVTTITTVGYGDMSAHTMLEKVVAVFIMLIGVFAFSIASGSLASYMS